MSHERLAVAGSDLDDLDVPEMEAYVRRRAPGLVESGSLEEAAVRLGLLAKTAPRVAPTAVGLLVFGRAPQLIQPDWAVVGLAMQGTTLADAVAARADLEGNLAALLAQALAFVRQQTGGRAMAALPESADEYPEAAVREAIVNALVHRDLRRAGRVAVRLFTDRLEVWSPGGPPEGLSDLDEQLRDGGISHPRNPLLAATARRWGSASRSAAVCPSSRGPVPPARAASRSAPRPATSWSSSLRAGSGRTPPKR